ncbi:MAG: glutamate racemase [Clostridiaceae bacterium]|nr:glutamate racemase [Clostridiaceae bacterium]
MIPAGEAQKPIGVFDSGLGGLTVLKAIMSRLPHENTVYFGDSGRAPYGMKSPETIVKFSRQNMRFLQEQKVKMIVIACNTASSCAYEDIREKAGVPVVEVVAPGAREAVRRTRNGRIGVIGTRGTVDSAVYIRAIKRYAPDDIFIAQQACPLFVGLAEEGWWTGDITRQVAEIYLAPLLKQQIDTLVLGCTHYPLLAGLIAKTAGPDVCLINAGNNVADEVWQTLASAGLLNEDAGTAGHAYYTSDSVQQFKRLGGAFLAQPIVQAERIDIEQY